MSNSSTRIRTYQYRLYPTRKQQRVLADMLEIARQFYNYALQYRRERWQESRKGVTYNEQCAMWRDWRNEDPDDNPLRLLNMTAGQQLLRRLDKAHREFIKGKRGLPRFKGKNRFHSLEFRHGDGCKFKVSDRTTFYVQNVGDVKVKFHRPLPDGATINHVILKRSVGKWYVYLQIEFDAPPAVTNRGEAVGIDVGLMRLLTLSDGTGIDNPRWMRGSLSKLRRAQRRLSRRKKGSRRRRKAAFQVAKLHEHIANTRRDFWHKTTTQLVNTYGAIALEDLNLSFMLHNRSLSLSAHDAGLGMFYTMLDSKAGNAGCTVIRVDPAYTSQVCSGCGCIVEKGLSVRVHDCPHCGLCIDRDLNAARNIYTLAFQSAWIEPSGDNAAPLPLPSGNGKRTRSLRSFRL